MPFHEIGHYRIARLIGLELHRTLLLEATLGFRLDQPKLYARFYETLDNYRLLKTIVQLMYDVSTGLGTNVDEQTQCDVIGASRAIYTLVVRRDPGQVASHDSARSPFWLSLFTFHLVGLAPKLQNKVPGSMPAMQVSAKPS